MGRTMAELTDDYGSKATEKKVFVGKCLKYYAKAQVGQFLLQAGDFNVGDKLLVTGPTTGAVFVEPESVLADGVAVQSVSKGMDVTFKVPEKIRENDKLYRIVSVTRSTKKATRFSARRSGCVF